MNKKQKKGFTLMELMTVIAIIAILAAFLLPALNSARREARRAQCMSNLKQVGIALHAYALDNDGKFPAALTGLANYLPTGPTANVNVTTCPGDKAAYNYSPGTFSADNIGPANAIGSCSTATAHPGERGRNYLYGDGHVEAGT